jgi:mannose/fructose/N-acetylgalactosamine-specific phosphotransferase system component IIC
MPLVPIEPIPDSRLRDFDVATRHLADSTIKDIDVKKVNNQKILAALAIYFRAAFPLSTRSVLPEHTDSLKEVIPMKRRPAS